MAGSTHKACFPLSKEAPDPLPHRIAGDGKSSGCFPEATTLLEGAYDLQSELHFALLVGELVSFGKGECQQGGIPPCILPVVEKGRGRPPSLLVEKAARKPGSPRLSPREPVRLKGHEPALQGWALGRDVKEVCCD